MATWASSTATVISAPSQAVAQRVRNALGDLRDLPNQRLGWGLVGRREMPHAHRGDRLAAIGENRRSNAAHLRAVLSLAERVAALPDGQQLLAQLRRGGDRLLRDGP